MCCLRYRPSKAVVQALDDFTIEKFGDEPFIDCTPVEIVSKGDVQDVPGVIGVTSEERLYPVNLSLSRNFKNVE